MTQASGIRDRGSGRTPAASVEIEALLPGVPVFHVTGYAEAELFVFRSPDDGRFRSLCPAPGLAGGLVPERRTDGWPPLPNLIRRAFPELVAQGSGIGDQGSEGSGS